MATFEHVTFDPTDPDTGTIFYITDVFGHQAELTKAEALQLFEWLGLSLAIPEQREKGAAQCTKANQ